MYIETWGSHCQKQESRTWVSNYIPTEYCRMQLLTYALDTWWKNFLKLNAKNYTFKCFCDPPPPPLIPHLLRPMLKCVCSQAVWRAARTSCPRALMPRGPSLLDLSQDGEDTVAAGARMNAGGSTSLRTHMGALWCWWGGAQLQTVHREIKQ